MKREDIRKAYQYLSKIDGLNSRLSALRESDTRAANLTLDFMKKDKTTYKVGIDPTSGMVDGIAVILISQIKDLEDLLHEMGIE